MPRNRGRGIRHRRERNEASSECPEGIYIIIYIIP